MNYQFKSRATKGKIHKISLAAALLMSMSTAWAEQKCHVETGSGSGVDAVDGVCYIGGNPINSTYSYHPRFNDEQVGQATVDEGELTLLGDGKKIHAGSYDTTVFLRDILHRWVDPNDKNNRPVRQASDLRFLKKVDPSRTVNTGIKDPITQNFLSIAAFNASELVTESRENESVYNSTALANGGIYMNMRLGTATGYGKLNVNLDNVKPNRGTPDSDSLEDRIGFYAKQTTLLEANDGGAVEWKGTKRRIVFYDTTDGEIPKEKVLTTTDRVLFKNKVHFDGVDYEIADHAGGDLEGFRAYNDALIAKLEAGRFPGLDGIRDNSQEAVQTAYLNALKQAYTTETIESYIKAPANSTDESVQPNGEKWVIRATGAANNDGAVPSHVKVSGLMSVYAYNGTDGEEGGAVLVDSRAEGQVTSTGKIAAMGGSAVVVKGPESQFTNNGVISAGFNTLIDIDTKDTPVVPTRDGFPEVFEKQHGGVYGIGYGARVLDFATFTNNNVINVASSQDKRNYITKAGLITNAGVVLRGGTAILAKDEATGAHSVINVAVNPQLKNIASTVAVRIDDIENKPSSTLTSQGDIYIGRSAQFSRGAETEEIAESNRTYGIYHRGQAVVNHSGNIHIGSQIKNSHAYHMEGDKGSEVNLTGDININGIIDNVGVYAENIGDSTINVGSVINLNTQGSKGVYAKDKVNADKLNVTGTINIHGGRDLTNGPNYGVWAEGSLDKGTAKVNFSGTANLTGTGGVGLHARGYSEITNTGAVNMKSGSDQIGYFLYGKDAALRGSAAVMDVFTDRSTMFRLEDGAGYNAEGLTITTTGEKSTAIIVSGESDDPSRKKSWTKTSGGTFNITGKGSNFITVEGGAEANLDSSSKVNLMGPGAVIGIVDGQGYNVVKAKKGDVKDYSRLTSSLNTVSENEGTNTYVVRTLGNLDYTGSYINLYGKESIAFKMEDGGKLKTLEGASFTVNGNFVQSHEENSYSNSNGGYTNLASFERTEVKAINVFNAQTGKLEVESRGQSLMTGAAITESDATSRFNISEESVWNITNNSNVTNLVNRGTINFVGSIVDVKNKAAYHNLSISENYLGVGGSTLSINSNWYDPNDVYTNTVVIKGNAVGRTRVIATNGIGGDVKAPQEGETGYGIEKLSDNLMSKYDPKSPVITVEGTDNFDNGTPTFVGESIIRDSALIAQLTKKGKNYYWTISSELPAKEKVTEVPKDDPKIVPLYVRETSAYLQTPMINRQMGLDLLGKLHERVGEQQFDCNCIKPQTWSRLSYTEGYNQGKERFAFGYKGGLVQFGQDIQFNVNEDRRVHFGLMAGYSWSNNRFYDKFNAENGQIKDDKETLGSKSQMANLGLYRTAYYNNGSYLDLNLSGNFVHNKYRTDDRHYSPTQTGYGVSGSVELGRLFQIGEKNWYIQPQVQLKGQHIRLDEFTDRVRRVKQDDSVILQGRVGARLTNGTFYASTNIVHDIVPPKTKVILGNSKLEERYNPTTADFALGGDVALDKNRKWQLYGDVKYSRALGKTNKVFKTNAPAENYSARVGIRYSW